MYVTNYDRGFFLYLALLFLVIKLVTLVLYVRWKLAVTYSQTRPDITSIKYTQHSTRIKITSIIPHTFRLRYVIRLLHIYNQFSLPGSSRRSMGNKIFKVYFHLPVITACIFHLAIVK